VTYQLGFSSNVVSIRSRAHRLRDASLTLAILHVLFTCRVLLAKRGWNIWKRGDLRRREGKRKREKRRVNLETACSFTKFRLVVSKLALIIVDRARYSAETAGSDKSPEKYLRRSPAEIDREIEFSLSLSLSLPISRLHLLNLFVSLSLFASFKITLDCSPITSCAFHPSVFKNNRYSQLIQRECYGW